MSSKTQVFFGQAAREGYMRGINIVADAVVPTLGPKGRCVLLSPGASRPKITKDGVSVAKSICLSDPLEEAGAQLIRNVAAQACSNAGDGTTTATLLARALIVEGHRLIAAGYDPISLKQGIDNSLVSVVEYLRARSRECTSLESLSAVPSRTLMIPFSPERNTASPIMLPMAVSPLAEMVATCCSDSSEVHSRERARRYSTTLTRELSMPCLRAMGS